MNKYKLSKDECEVLDIVSSRSKMDCWFELGCDEDGNDVVIDLENDKVMPLYDGIMEMNDGLTSLDDYNLDEHQKEIYINLISKLRKTNISNERLRILLYNTMVFLEDEYCCGDTDYYNLRNNLLEEIGMTWEEYDAIMKKED